MMNELFNYYLYTYSTVVSDGGGTPKQRGSKDNVKILTVSQQQPGNKCQNSQTGAPGSLFRPLPRPPPPPPPGSFRLAPCCPPWGVGAPCMDVI